MKTLLSVFLFCLICSFCKATDLPIVIKGCYVVRYERSAIEKYFKQEKRKAKELSYSLIADFEQRRYFLPTEIAGVTVADKNSIFSKIGTYSNMRKDTIYFLPFRENIYRYYSKLDQPKPELSREIDFFRRAIFEGPFYREIGNERYLYQVVYIEANAKAFNITNDIRTRLKLDIDIDAVNKESNTIFLYLFGNSSITMGI